MTVTSSRSTLARLACKRAHALLAAGMVAAAGTSTDAQILVPDDATLETAIAPHIVTVAPLQDLHLRPEFQGIHLDGSVRKNPPNLDLAGNPFEASRLSDLGGINLATGTYDRRFVDLSGAGWTHARDYNARQHDGTTDHDSNGPQGKNWVHTSQPELAAAIVSGQGRYALHWGAAYYVFRVDGVFSPAVNGSSAVLEYVAQTSPTPDYLILRTPRGDKVYFFSPFDADAGVGIGQFWKHEYPDGSVVYAGDPDDPVDAIANGYYDDTDPDTEGKIKSVTDLDGFEFVYTYDDSTGQLIRVDRENASNVVIDTVQYTYYAGTGNSAVDGNLESVTRTTTLSDGAETLVRKSHYRYNTSGLLAMVVDPEGYRRADLIDGVFDDDPLNHSTINDTTLKPYTTAHFTEYSDRKITKVYFNGQCGCSGGDNGEMVITYTDNGSFVDAAGYTQNSHNWERRAVVDPSSTLVDAQTVYYFDDLGQTLSTVRRTNLSGTPNDWVTFVRRNSDSAVDLIATPEAVDTYNHTNGEITLHAGAGLVHSITRTTGAVPLRGFATATGWQVGTGSATLLTETTYDTRDHAFSVSAILRRPYVLTRKVYQDVGVGHTTTYTPTFTAGEMLPDKIVTTMPIVDDAKNGSDSAISTSTYFDDNGRVLFTESADGTISYTEYDDAGRVTLTVQDADVDDPNWDSNYANVVPSGLTVTGSDPLHLETARSYDELGRLHRITEPNGHVTEYHHTHLADQRPVSIVVPLVDTSGTTTYYGPASYTVSNQAGGTELSATIAITSGSTTTDIADWISTVQSIDSTSDGYQAVAADALNTSPDFASEAAITRLSSTIHDESGQRVDETRTYFEIPGSWPGSDGTHFDRTAFGYDELGRRHRVKDQTDTIRRTVFDDLDRPVEQWVGTNDNSFPGGEPSGTDNMVKISETVYDTGGIGNGHVTKTTAFVQDSTADKRETTYAHDVRGRTTLVTRPVQPKYAATSYNNQGAVLKTAQFKGATPPTDPDTTTNRVSLSENRYDEWGRVYESRTYEINQSTGAIVQSGSPLDDHYLANLTWYDEEGRVAKTVGRYVVKNEYDRLGRLTDRYTLADDEDSGDYAQALAIQADDIVVEQHKTVYENSTASDDLGRVLMSVSYERRHDATSTGRLDTNADDDDETITMANAADAFVQITSFWYDALGRNIATAAYGTNGGSNFTYSTTVPTYSSLTEMVSKTTYHPDGSLKSTIQVGDGVLDDVVTTYEYDDGGRQVTVIQNNEAGSTASPTRDNDLYSRTEYANGMVKETWVDIDGDGVKDADDQRTIYTYGVTEGTAPANSLVTRNDLLREIQYPGHTVPKPDKVRYEYNALGERIAFIDQTGNIHEYTYDEGGRMRADAVTLQTGAGFSDWVERISTVYNDRGMVATVTQYDDPSAGSVVNQLAYEYDNWGELTTFKQDNDSIVDAMGGTPTYATFYTFSHTTAAKKHLFRVLEQLEYPDMTSLAYEYGSGTSSSVALGRVVSMQFDSVPLAAYGYTGLSRVVYAELPEPYMSIRLYDGSDDYDALDRFARITNTRWQANDMAAPTNLIDLEYAYNVRGQNAAVVNAIHSDSGGRVQDRRYNLDDLGRIIGEDRGDWDGSSLWNQTQDQTWAFDQLANWATHVNDAETLNEIRTHNLSNELVLRDTDSDSSDDIILVYDANGNLIDNVQISTENGARHVYDAWNRLVEIKRISPGGITDTLAVYEYDGLGRRISWLEDTDDDGDADANDDQMNLALDASGRMLNTYHRNSVIDTPIERFVYHAASPAVGNAASSVILLRDWESAWTSGPDGELDERHYYLPDAHGNVAAVITSEHVQVEQVTYDWRGMPFNHPRGDWTGDGIVNEGDYPESGGGSGCDIRKDVDLDGDCDLDDETLASFVTGGYGVLSFQENGNRFGFQMLQIAYAVSPVLFFEIRCGEYDAALGRAYGTATCQPPNNPSRPVPPAPPSEPPPEDDCATFVEHCRQFDPAVEAAFQYMNTSCAAPADGAACSGFSISCKDNNTDCHGGRGATCPSTCEIKVCPQGLSCATLANELVHAGDYCNGLPTREDKSGCGAPGNCYDWACTQMRSNYAHCCAETSQPGRGTFWECFDRKQSVTFMRNPSCAVEWGQAQKDPNCVPAGAFEGEKEPCKNFGIPTYPPRRD